MKISKFISGICAPVFLFIGFFGTVQAACTHDGFCDRPIKMGVSISTTPSSPFIFAGTAGMRVRALNNPNRKYILSNNHVMGAIGPSLCPNTADGWPPPLTWTLQPGTLDIGNDPGNDPTYVAGATVGYQPINFSGGSNTVDAAIAITSTSLASAEILGIGLPTPQLGQASLGMPLIKSGRTSGVTTGTVTAVNSAVVVNYGSSCGNALFANQVITSAALGTSGDSGSVVLEQSTNKPVGLYFAGSPSSGVMNPILDVYLALGVFVDGATPVATPTSEADLRKQFAALPVDPRVENLKPVQAHHQPRILAVPGVVGMGIAVNESGDPTLAIFVEKLNATVRRALPVTLDGNPVRLIETGEFKAH